MLQVSTSKTTLIPLESLIDNRATFRTGSMEWFVNQAFSKMALGVSATTLASYAIMTTISFQVGLVALVISLLVLSILLIAETSRRLNRKEYLSVLDANLYSYARLSFSLFEKDPTKAQTGKEDVYVISVPGMLGNQTNLDWMLKEIKAQFKEKVNIQHIHTGTGTVNHVGYKEENIEKAKRVTDFIQKLFQESGEKPIYFLAHSRGLIKVVQAMMDYPELEKNVRGIFSFGGVVQKPVNQDTDEHVKKAAEYLLPLKKHMDETKNCKYYFIGSESDSISPLEVSQLNSENSLNVDVKINYLSHGAYPFSSVVADYVIDHLHSINSFHTENV